MAMAQEAVPRSCLYGEPLAPMPESKARRLGLLRIRKWRPLKPSIRGFPMPLAERLDRPDSPDRGADRRGMALLVLVVTIGRA